MVLSEPEDGDSGSVYAAALPRSAVVQGTFQVTTHSRNVPVMVTVLNPSVAFLDCLVSDAPWCDAFGMRWYCGRSKYEDKSSVSLSRRLNAML